MSSVTWQSYCQYLRDWADSHGDPGFEGCCPACYDEFLDGDWPALHSGGAEPSATGGEQSEGRL